MKYNLVTLVVIMILKDTAAFQVLVWFLYFVLGTSLLWRSTVTFTYLKVKSAKCLCLLPVVLVLFFRSWSWSWSCVQRSWSWSCYFGLGLKNLVLLTSLQGLRAGGACCPLPKNPTPLSAFGSLYQQSSFPPILRDLDKSLVIPIFGAEECIRMHDFVFKIYKKNRGSPRRKGRHLFAPTPVPTFQMLVPLRFF